MLLLGVHNGGKWTGFLLLVAFALPNLDVAAQTTFSDSFNISRDYLTNGVVGTIWDGVYFGAGEFNNTGLGGGGPGDTLQCNSHITAPGTLSLQTTGTAWEGGDDDGFFLYKVVAGDFSAIVHVVSPFDNTGYNTAGLQARAFSAGGDPFGGTENFVSWTRFDQFSFANYLRNEVNGAVDQINPGDYPNSDYWLRMDRVGNSFRFYQKATAGAAWSAVSFPAPVSGESLNRPDLAGQPLQVGIIHATFAGELGVQFTDFSLTISNLTNVVVPSAVTSVTATPLPEAQAEIAWPAVAGSDGSLVTLWTGSSVLKQSPAAATTYFANASFGLGTPLPGINCFVVYSGPGTSVTVSNLVPGQTYHAAVFSYSGAGSGRVYSHTPAQTSFVASNTVVPVGPVAAAAELAGTNVLISFTPTVGKWYRVQYTDFLDPADWREVSDVAQLAVSSPLSVWQIGGATAAQRFYRVQQFDQPPVKENLAEAATPTTSYVSPWENLNAINDGFEPADSSDHSHGGYGNWPYVGTQWVEYEWNLPITTCRSDVYWWSDGGGIMPPSACRFKYWNGSNYELVPNASGLGVLLDQYNVTTHAPVATTRMRLEFDAGAASTGILEWRVYDAGDSPTNWPGAPESSQFAVKVNSGVLTGLKRKQDLFGTEYLAGRLGDVNLKYRQTGTNWISAQTVAFANSAAFGWNSNSTVYSAHYRLTNGVTPMVALRVELDFANNTAINWNISLTNLTGQSLEVGDLAVPLPMNTTYSSPSSSVFKHSFISGHSSWIFWMRPNSVGPYLFMTPAEDTKLEYWDQLGSGGGYEAFVHSQAAAETAALQGTQWRLPNTSLTLTPGGAQSYGFKFQWADDYDVVRQLIVDEGKIDVHVVPGMTIPTNLFARFALHTTQTVNSVMAEFPADTLIQFLGNNGGYLPDLPGELLPVGRKPVDHRLWQ